MAIRRNRSQCVRAHHRLQGMTLIETMVVIVIVALAAAGTSFAFNAIERTQLRSACVRIGAAARWAYGRAIAEGMTVRLVFDLDNETMAFEEARGRVALTRGDDPRRLEIERDDDQRGDLSVADPWAAARARLDTTLQPSFGASPFSPIPGSRYAAKPLGSRVTIERLIVPHELEPIVSGKGSVYFFPGGFTEHSVIWLSDGGDQVFSVELHPLTARVQIRAHAYEPDELLDGEEGELEE